MPDLREPGAGRFPPGGQAMSAWTLDSCCDLLQAAGDTLRPGGLKLTGRLLELGGLGDGSRLLDAGCGTGATLRYLAGTGRLTAVGVDCSESLLAAARQESSSSPLVRAALEALPFAASSFDGIVCECVLSQTPVAAVLREFARVLKPAGRLLVSDLYLKSPRRASDPMPDRPAIAGQPATKEQSAGMLADAGFGVQHWEDRSAELRQLTAQLIMAPGPARANLYGWSRPAGCGQEKGTRSAWQDVGYQLLVAGRTTP